MNKGPRLQLIFSVCLSLSIWLFLACYRRSAGNTWILHAAPPHPIHFSIYQRILHLSIYNTTAPLPPSVIGTADHDWTFFYLGMMHFNYHDPVGAFLFDGYTLQIPYWLPMLATLAFLAWSYRRWVNFNRIQSEGRCSHCHYDLRAHNPSDLCPECGTPIPPQSATIIPTKGNPS